MADPADPDRTVLPDEAIRPPLPARSRFEPAADDAAARAARTPSDLSGEWSLRGVPLVEFDGARQPVLGAWVILSRVAAGGMGTVFRAVHRERGSEAAVKVLHPGAADQQAGAVERFLREARIAAGLRSPHLVSVEDVACDGTSGAHYLVMEFVAGPSARHWLERCRKDRLPPTPERVALDIVVAATTGLAAAHAAGVVHRDVKPANILLPADARGRPAFAAAKLSDLGLARFEDGGHTLTATGLGLGTPGYMAPEQARGAADAGKPADVFGMGATLYALLAGEAPFRGTTPYEVLAATVACRYRPLRQVRPDASVATAALVARCLAGDPSQRFPDAEALLAALREVVAALGDAAREAAVAARLAPPTSGSEAETVVGSDEPTCAPCAGETGAGRGTSGAAGPALSANSQSGAAGTGISDGVAPASPAQGAVAGESRGADPRPSSRRRWLLASVAIVGVAAVVFVVGAFRNQSKAPRSASEPASAVMVAPSAMSVSTVDPVTHQRTDRRLAAGETYTLAHDDRVECCASGNLIEIEDDRFRFGPGAVFRVEVPAGRPPEITLERGEVSGTFTGDAGLLLPLARLELPAGGEAEFRIVLDGGVERPGPGQRAAFTSRLTAECRAGAIRLSPRTADADLPVGTRRAGIGSTLFAGTSVTIETERAVRGADLRVTAPVSNATAIDVFHSRQRGSVVLTLEPGASVGLATRGPGGNEVSMEPDAAPSSSVRVRFVEGDRTRDVGRLRPGDAPLVLQGL